MFIKNHSYYPPKDKKKWLAGLRERAKARRGIPLSEEHKRKLSLAKTDKPKAGYKITNGYKYLFLPKHPLRRSGKYYAEHRYVLENYLRKKEPTSEYLEEVEGKKYLKKGIVVHHVDRDKLNNKAENLMASERKKHHGHLVTCPHCHKTFNY